MNKQSDISLVTHTSSLMAVDMNTQGDILIASKGLVVSNNTQCDILLTSNASKPKPLTDMITD